MGVGVVTAIRGGFWDRVQFIVGDCVEARVSV
jgi:hypothetical protein